MLCDMLCDFRRSTFCRVRHQQRLPKESVVARLSKLMIDVGNDASHVTERYHEAVYHKAGFQHVT